MANQIKAICHAAKAKYETAGTNGNADTALIKHYRDNGWHDLADKLEAVEKPRLLRKLKGDHVFDQLVQEYT